MIEAFRAQQVTISVPKPDSIPFITMAIQRLEVDGEGNILAETARVEQVYRNAENVAGEVFEFTDPVTGQDIRLSIAGLDVAVRAISNHWTAETLGGEIGPSGYTEIIRK